MGIGGVGEARIVSRSAVLFADRVDAGTRLAEQLTEFRADRPVVIGIPRGGVVVAYQVWLALGGDLDVVLAHKLGYPGQEELAFGAISEDGHVSMNEDLLRKMPLSERQIEQEKAEQLKLLEKRAAAIRKIRPKVSLAGRSVIVVDDGVATGATTMAALEVVRAEAPKRLVAAVPVGPAETISDISRIVDVVVCLSSPPLFFAVGQSYRHFEPVEDGEMLRLLREARTKAEARSL